MICRAEFSWLRGRRVVRVPVGAHARVVRRHKSGPRVESLLGSIHCQIIIFDYTNFQNNI